MTTKVNFPLKDDLFEKDNIKSTEVYKTAQNIETFIIGLIKPETVLYVDNTYKYLFLYMSLFSEYGSTSFLRTNPIEYVDLEKEPFSFTTNQNLRIVITGSVNG